MKKKVLIPKFRAPKGFFFKIHKGWYEKRLENVMICLFETATKRNIGHVNLVKCDRFMETHSYLEDKYHNRGLGVLMYERAIQWALENDFKVRSSGGSSDKAQRVWRGKTIRKNFRIRTYKSNYEPYKNDPNCDTFFAYPR